MKFLEAKKMVEAEGSFLVKPNTGRYAGVFKCAGALFHLGGTRWGIYGTSLEHEGGRNILFGLPDIEPIKAGEDGH